jgi:prepilin-type processing-associated H-X9-DG protein
MLLNPYVANRALWTCPNSSPERYCASSAHDRGGSVTCSRSDWGWDVDYSTSSEVMPTATMGGIKDPAHIIIFVEQSCGHYRRWRNYRPPPTELKHEVWERMRHNDGANYTFLDGHAKWFHGAKFPNHNYAAVWPSEDVRMEFVWCPVINTPP